MTNVGADALSRAVCAEEVQLISGRAQLDIGQLQVIMLGCPGEQWLQLCRR